MNLKNILYKNDYLLKYFLGEITFSYSLYFEEDKEND